MKWISNSDCFIKRIHFPHWFVSVKAAWKFFLQLRKSKVCGWFLTSQQNESSWLAVVALTWSLISSAQCFRWQKVIVAVVSYKYFLAVIQLGFRLYIYIFYTLIGADFCCSRFEQMNVVELWHASQQTYSQSGITKIVYIIQKKGAFTRVRLFFASFLIIIYVIFFTGLNRCWFKRASSRKLPWLCAIFWRASTIGNHWAHFQYVALLLLASYFPYFRSV